MKKSGGFTLIELLMVVSLSVMLMLASSALFLTFLMGSAKVARLQQVKNEGEHAMAQMEFLFRNAVGLETNNEDLVCETGMSSVAFKSYDNKITTLFAEVDPTDNVIKIASNSGVYLTSSDIEITEGPVFDCSESADGLAQYVGIRFKLKKGLPDDEEKDVVEQEFISGVGMRTF